MDDKLSPEPWWYEHVPQDELKAGVTRSDPTEAFRWIQRRHYDVGDVSASAGIDYDGNLILTTYNGKATAADIPARVGGWPTHLMDIHWTRTGDADFRTMSGTAPEEPGVRIEDWPNLADDTLPYTLVSSKIAKGKRADLAKAFAQTYFVGNNMWRVDPSRHKKPIVGSASTRIPFIVSINGETLIARGEIRLTDQGGDKVRIDVEAATQPDIATAERLSTRTRNAKHNFLIRYLTSRWQRRAVSGAQITPGVDL